MALEVGPLSVLLVEGLPAYPNPRLRDGGNFLLTGTVTPGGVAAGGDRSRARGGAHPVSGSIIRTSGLTKAYRGLRAVDAVDLDVREGDVYGFLGANGSGKTTTVRMLLGLVLANAGRGADLR